MKEEEKEWKDEDLVHIANNEDGNVQKIRWENTGEGGSNRGFFNCWSDVEKDA